MGRGRRIGGERDSKIVKERSICRRMYKRERKREGFMDRTIKRATIFRERRGNERRNDKIEILKSKFIEKFEFRKEIEYKRGRNGGIRRFIRIKKRKDIFIINIISRININIEKDGVIANRIIRRIIRIVDSITKRFIIRIKIEKSMDSKFNFPNAK